MRPLFLIGFFLCLLATTVPGEHAPPTQAAPPLLEMQTRMIDLANQARAAEGVQALLMKDYLNQAAQNHTDEMIALHYFEHHSPTPGQETVLERVRSVGGQEHLMAENIYEDDGTLCDEEMGEIFQDWLEHPGHRHNLLNPEYNLAGVGLGYDARNKNVYATLVFAKAR